MTRPPPITKAEQATVDAAVKRLEQRQEPRSITLDAVRERLRAGVLGLASEVPPAMRGAMAVILRELAKEVGGKRGA